MNILRAYVPTFFILLSFTNSVDANDAVTPRDHPPKMGFGPGDVAVIINDADPLSREIAAYYKARRQIPDANMIHVRFQPGVTDMSRADFQKIKAKVDARTPKEVQAYVLTWAVPYRVDCMSITTAFAAGFDQEFCASKLCGHTKSIPYYNSNSRAPYTDYKIRPTMALAGRSFNEVTKLIDRGVASDSTFPRGTGYLVSTTDKARNVRAEIYPAIIAYLGDRLNLKLIHADFIQNRQDVLFYFTGALEVNALSTNVFVPGAIADHLTSSGGALTDSVQMSSLRWLEAGATGSYGTVVEPCNHPNKFPNPGIVISRYYQGETLIEAYWKSVAWPGEGIFIGEPLAAPYRYRTVISNVP